MVSSIDIWPSVGGEEVRETFLEKGYSKMERRFPFREKARTSMETRNSATTRFDAARTQRMR